MIRYIFYLAFGYIVLKLLRVFIDPLFQSKSVPTNTPNFVPNQKEKQAPLGEYVDYEEIK